MRAYDRQLSLLPEWHVDLHLPGGASYSVPPGVVVVPLVVIAETAAQAASQVRARHWGALSVNVRGVYHDAES